MFDVIIVKIVDITFAAEEGFVKYFVLCLLFAFV